jgi:hypothetical protein
MNGSRIMFMVVLEKVVECEEKKTFCKDSTCMNVLHCRGLEMVVMLEKTMMGRQGMIHCNILVTQSLKKEQLKKKSIKSSSPCQKAQ